MNIDLYNRSARSFVGKVKQRMVAWEVPVEHWTIQQAEYRAPGDTIRMGEAVPIAPGTAWSGETALFTAQTVLPDTGDAPLWLLFENDGEGLLYLNGEPVMGLDPGRTMYPLRQTGRVDILVESTWRWQNLAHAKQNGVEYPMQFFRRASLCTLREPVHKCWNTLSCLLESIQLAKGGWAVEMLDHARLHLKPDIRDDALFLDQVVALNEWMDQRLKAAQEQKPEGALLAVGHSHLDLAYLWPAKETVRKCGRTFANILELLDSYPSFCFTQSQPILYTWAKEYYPSLLERVRAYSRTGRWETVGAMYVEADGNMPSAESYIRQFLYGTEIMQETLGVSTRIGWLPDTFGLTGILPQIMKKCGLDYFYSAKLRSNEHYTFPYRNYWWEGIDGSKVLCTLDMHGTYNGAMTLEEIGRGQQRLTESGQTHGDGLYVYGYGDGGGGVTREMLARMDCYDHLPEVPRMRCGRAEAYFDALARQGDALPTWSGEKYYDVHQGTLTSRAVLKKWNRYMENLLRMAELMAVLRDDAAVYRDVMDMPWKIVLFNQFHDILTGSHQTSVAEKAVEEYKEAEQALLAYMRPAQNTGMAYLWNSLSFGREEIILLEEGGLRVDGEALPAQRLSDGRHAVLVPEIGALGALEVEWCALPPPAYEGTPLARETDGKILLENSSVMAAIDTVTGQLVSLVGKDTRREYLSETGNRFELYDELYEFYDAWNIHPETVKHPQPLDGSCAVSLVDNGPLMATVLVEWRFAASTITQHIVVKKDSARIDFETEVDWHETSRMLRVAFDADIFSTKAVFDLSCGNMERSTRSNLLYEQTQIETCGHKWADISDGRHGLALLNDCKYGYSVKGATLRLTLLKSPNYPDPDCDRGRHQFTYAIYLHVGDFRRGGVDREGLRLNAPLLLSEAGTAINSCVCVDDPAVFVEAIKYAHDGSGDIIVRLYENHGGACDATVGLAGMNASEVWRCTMLEQPQDRCAVEDDATCIAFGAYEIVTLRIKQSN